jgi:hypothetical protein
MLSDKEARKIYASYYGGHQGPSAESVWDGMTRKQKDDFIEREEKVRNKIKDEASKEEKFRNRKLKLIFTKEDKKTARKKIGGFRQSYIIDARELVLEFDYEPGQEVSSPHEFIINKELEKKMAQALVNKKSQQIVYFHYEITPDLVKNVKSFFRANKANIEFFLYDPVGEFKKIKRLFHGILN